MQHHILAKQLFRSSASSLVRSPRFRWRYIVPSWVRRGKGAGTKMTPWPEGAGAGAGWCHHPGRGVAFHKEEVSLTQKWSKPKLPSPEGRNRQYSNGIMRSSEYNCWAEMRSTICCCTSLLLPSKGEVGNEQSDLGRGATARTRAGIQNDCVLQFFFLGFFFSFQFTKVVSLTFFGNKTETGL